MSVARLLVGQRFHVGVGLDDGIFGQFGYGKHFLYVGHQAVESGAFLFVLEFERGIFVERRIDHVGDAVAVIGDFAYLHKHRNGRVAVSVGVGVVGLGLCIRRETQDEKNKCK